MIAQAIFCVVFASFVFSGCGACALLAWRNWKDGYRAGALIGFVPTLGAAVFGTMVIWYSWP